MCVTSSIMRVTKILQKKHIYRPRKKGSHRSLVTTTEAAMIGAVEALIDRYHVVNVRTR